LIALVALEAEAYGYWDAFPQGTVGLTRPAIGRRIHLESGDLFDRAEMWLDGVEVQPVWDAATGYAQYLPPVPLSPGQHHVVLKIRVKSTTPGRYYDPLISDYSFTVASDALTALPPADQENLLALTYMNSLRVAAGLPVFTYSPALGQAAEMHARHLALDKTADAHTEVLGTPFATGVQPWDRAGYYGYFGGVGEVVAYCGDAVSAIDSWMTTLYHRIPLVYPGNTEFGYGHAGPDCQTGFAGARLAEVIDCGPYTAEAKPALARYPYPGQTGVPTWWPGGEHPDPFRLYPGTTGPVGYTITLTWAGNPEDLDLTTWSLTGPGGESTAVMTFTPDNDSFLREPRNTVALIPYEPLAPDATYTVSLEGIVDLGAGPRPYAEEWSFQTASGQIERATGYSYRWSNQGDALIVTFNEGLSLRPGVRAYLDGLPLRDMAVSGSRAELTCKLPEGYGRRQPQGLLLATTDGEEHRLDTFGTNSDGTPLYLGTGAPSAFSATTVNLGPGATEVAALRHVGGTIIVPENVLADLGATRQTVPEIERTHWVLNGHTGCATMGSTLAWIDGLRVGLPLPVRVENAQTYVPKEFVDALLGASRTFVDVRGGWAEGYITRLVALGVVNGFGDGTFRPDATLTRSAFIKMLVAGLDLSPRPGDAGGFSDTAASWVVGQGYLGAAVAAGIVGPQDYPGGRLDPEGDITREEIAVMVVRAMGLDEAARERTVTIEAGRATIGDRAFSDAGTWRHPGYVAVAVDESVVKGFQENDGTYTFRPVASATRAQAAAMISGMLDAMAAGGG
jgi:uncharacterized protein YkwD